MSMIAWERWQPSLEAFEQWLSAENAQAALIWSCRCRSHEVEQVESAVAEALAWDFIRQRCDSARLNDSPGTGGCDFEFAAGDRRFIVEVTNISTAAATTASGKPDTDTHSSYYSLLTKQIRSKVRGKLQQAQRSSDHPTLVFVTTLHWNASRVCVSPLAVEAALGSPPNITGNWNPATGAVEGELYQSTDLKQSVFLSPQPISGPHGGPVAQAKYQPISGFLVGGLGLTPWARVFGALNPEAHCPFDPVLMRDVPFCSFEEWPITARMEFAWTITEEEQNEREHKAAQRRLRDSGHGDWLDAILAELHRQR